MFYRSPDSRSRKIVAQLSLLASLLFAGTIYSLRAQSPQTSVPPAPEFTETEKALAEQIAALSPDDGLKTIASADAPKMTEGLYRALRQIAMKATDTDPVRAVVLYREAEAAATRAGSPILAADAHLNQAIWMAGGGEMFDSLDVFSKALAMYKAADAPPRKIANSFMSRAVVSLKLGDLPATIADDKEASRISRDAGDEVGVARADNGLGNAYVAAGSFTEAEEAFTEALKLARAHGEKLGEAFVLNNMSMMHASQGDYPMAVRLCEQSLEIKRQAGNKANLPTSLLNLGNFYDEVGRDADANRVLTESAQLGKELNNKEAVAKATSEMGIIQLEHHHPAEALKLLQEGLDLGSDSEDLGGRAQTLHKIAEAHYDLKDYAQALKYSQDAVAIDVRAGMLDHLSDAAYVEGRACLALGQLKEARSALEQSIAAIEQLRNNVVGGAAARQNFMAQRTDPYRLLAVVAAMEGDWPLALDSSEKGKGRILLDLYTGSGLSTGASLTDAERAEETRLRSRFLSLDMQFDRQVSLPVFDPAKKNALDANLREAKAALGSFREKLFAQHPELRLRRAEFASLTLNDVQRLIPDRSTALMEYELTPSGNYLFAITRGAGDTAEIHGYKLAASGDDLTRHVHRFHEQLAGRDPEFATDARWLYTALLQPARAQLRNVKSLVVVPDGVLWQIPFQALERPDGKFLVESTAIEYIPSLAVLSALKSVPVRPNRTRTLLAMGNPRSDTQEQADEALAVEKLYGPKNTHVLIGKAATLGQFRQISPSFDVVHIAAHGIFDDREPMSSHMLLASETDQPQAGWLRAREIQSMQLQAELVVLSGCETGRGSFEDGEGLVGMSWATLAAGAHVSLASAWRVEAASTTTMMIAFHQNMLHGITKAESLRRAEVALLHNDKFAHPFYWAAFVLMGDGTPTSAL